MPHLLWSLVMSTKLAREARQAATRAAQERMQAEIEERLKKRAAAAEAERAANPSTGEKG